VLQSIVCNRTEHCIHTSQFIISDDFTHYLHKSNCVRKIVKMELIHIHTSIFE